LRRPDERDFDVKKKLLAALLAAAPLSAASAMDVATFLTKAEALKKKGMLAMMSSDYELLKRQIQVDSRALYGERMAAERAGRKPAYCPPGKQWVAPEELLASFRTIPAAQRPRVQVKDGLRALLARKYPCRG
jgi:hypothetical protein